MGAELTLNYGGVAELESDFVTNLRKGRAFVRGATGLTEREYCTLRIEHPTRGASLCLRAEAVWIDEDPENGGTGVQFVNFDVDARGALQAFVEGPTPSIVPNVETTPPPESSQRATAELVDPDTISEPPSARRLHDRIRDLSIAEREVVARQGSLPERVALERRFGSSVWEGLLHNPQLSTREVLRMAKSTSLPATLVNVIVANKGWLSDGSIQSALLANPRVSGANLDRVLRALPQAELVRVSEQAGLRMQVRQGAKRLIRR